MTVRVLAALVVAACLTFVTALLIAGVGPWSGRQLFTVSTNHGVHEGDIPVMVAWLCGMAGCAYLALTSR